MTFAMQPQSQQAAIQEKPRLPHSHNVAAAPAPARGGGPISQLQEYVQSDRRFPVSSHRPILSWDFDTRMANAVTLEFRATVSFVLEGVPHHAVGSWQSSKKGSQRDTAERVLGLLIGKWGGFAAPKVVDCTRGRKSETLAAFCAELSGNCGDNPPQWRCDSNGNGWQAIVDLNLFGGVTHTIQGAVCCDAESAREDTALRALWYLRCPGYENAFEISPEATAAETLPLPSQSDWQRNGWGPQSEVSSDAKQRAAEQKTLLMRLQNRLQKNFAKELPQGASVWEWSYDYSLAPNGTAPLCRAKVKMAVVDREFLGQWCYGQKSAQLDTCNAVMAFLDEFEEQEEQASRL